MKMNTNKYILWAGLLLCTALGTLAVPVTFSVNMDYQTTNATPTFTPGGAPTADTVEVKGSFNGWGPGVALVNVPGSGWYTNTIDVAGTAGDTIYYKYHTYGTHGDQWDSYLGYIYDPTGGNRTFVLANSAQTLPQQFFGDIWGGTLPLTVQVDMLYAIIAGTFTPGSDTVEIAGSFHTDWVGRIALTNDPAGITAPTNIYSMTFVIGPDIKSTAPGGRCAYKFHTYGTHDVWESDPNRIASIESPATSWPYTCFNRACLPPVPVAIALQVDMTSQIAALNFAEGIDQVWADGDNLGGWGDPPQGLQLLEVPGQPGIYSNYWTGMISPGANFPFKFKMWAPFFPYAEFEGLATNRFVVWTGTEPPDGAGNHLINVPLSRFGFWQINSNDYLPNDTVVTFTVDMNGAVGTDGHAFDPAADAVYVNGPFVTPASTPFSTKWWQWVKTVGVDPAPSSTYQLTEVPPLGSKIYAVDITLPKGTPIRAQYKYSINGVDDEAGSFQDRFRDVRTLGLAKYAFPHDIFGLQWNEFRDDYPPRDFGGLQIGAPSGGTVPVQWLGRPGVHLQTATDLTGGSWTDHLNTDGTSWTAGIATTNGLASVTNYPMTAGATFFRLVKPGP